MSILCGCVCVAVLSYFRVYIHSELERGSAQRVSCVWPSSVLEKLHVGWKVAKSEGKSSCAGGCLSMCEDSNSSRIMIIPHCICTYLTWGRN